MANVIKTLKTNDFISIAGIRKASNLHYNTICEYLELIQFIQKKMPLLILEKSNSLPGIRIQRQPDLIFEPIDEVILFLFDEHAFRKTMAIEKQSWIDDEILIKAKDLGLIVIAENKLSLTPEGILVGVKIAEHREKLLIYPIGQQYSIYSENYSESSILSSLGTWVCSNFRNKQISEDRNREFIRPFKNFGRHEKFHQMEGI